MRSEGAALALTLRASETDFSLPLPRYRRSALAPAKRGNRPDEDRKLRCFPQAPERRNLDASRLRSCFSDHGHFFAAEVWSKAALNLLSRSCIGNRLRSSRTLKLRLRGGLPLLVGRPSDWSCDAKCLRGPRPRTLRISSGTTSDRERLNPRAAAVPRSQGGTRVGASPRGGKSSADLRRAFGDWTAKPA